ncbi:DNA polymerase III delta' subunit [Gemmatimonas aurantiaca T-27]|uniref:DNA polymerase III delta' subunit n=1 Tax=Gemmatimonas aurantiaca (strain DSM 14586 / JCM 11422 / NBRC 100505 / T-27) TaxID=379066 RepID=C1A9U0_GEMAT|nr:DNA polymerase III, delta' subunit [Gemmatimonas aurantiaca]BAH39267.1 DNA polymerase III delta' subunit [Gemmatimonas aurantiaca T-27]
MSFRPLYGHHPLRQRLTAAASDGRLPASLLFQGRRGVGKQRLGLWLGQFLLCDRATTEGLREPCGACQHCRYAERGVHPDLHWFFPRPRLKDGDASTDDVKADVAEAVAERMGDEGLWSPPPGTEGLYVATVRALVHMASLRPAMARRAVFVVGDAERMVSQEGADQAANAFLKLLEEPPNGTTLLLTTSEPGALLPTIKSRVVSVRVPPLTPADMDAFLSDAVVERKFARTPREELLARANGAPGALLAGDSMSAAFTAARRILEAALAPNTPDGTAERIKAAAKQGVAGARGSFSDTLDALTLLLHARAKQLTLSGHDVDARRTASTLLFVENAKTKAQGNVSPQLLMASLLTSLHQTLNP